MKNIVFFLLFSLCFSCNTKPRVISAQITASSTLEPYNTYAPDWMLDGRADTAWSEGVKGYGEGQTITITLSEPISIDRIRILNGYQRSAPHYKKNSRPKDIYILINNIHVTNFQCTDDTAEQVILLPKTYKKITSLKIEIASVYKGRNYADTCISEISLYKKDSKYIVKTPFKEHLTREMEDKVKGTVMADIMDRYWYLKHPGQSIESGSNLDLMFYSDGTFEADSREEEVTEAYPDYEVNSDRAFTVYYYRQTYTTWSGHWEIVRLNEKTAVLKVYGVTFYTVIRAKDTYETVDKDLDLSVRPFDGPLLDSEILSEIENPEELFSGIWTFSFQYNNKHGIDVYDVNAAGFQGLMEEAQ